MHAYFPQMCQKKNSMCVCVRERLSEKQQDRKNGEKEMMINFKRDKMVTLEKSWERIYEILYTVLHIKYIYKLFCKSERFSK